MVEYPNSRVNRVRIKIANAVIESHLAEPSHTFYELVRIVLTFGLIGLGIWIVIKLMLRSGKRASDHRVGGVNRQQRRADRARAKRRRR